jgi:toxin ParE1/3/4
VIRFRPAAARELAADVRYYAKHYAAAAATGSPLPSKPPSFPSPKHPASLQSSTSPTSASAKVARFPYRVVYVVLGADIDVLAVAHAKRRPGYWRRRVK